MTAGLVRRSLVFSWCIPLFLQYHLGLSVNATFVSSCLSLSLVNSSISISLSPTATRCLYVQLRT